MRVLDWILELKRIGNRSAAAHWAPNGYVGMRMIAQIRKWLPGQGEAAAAYIAGEVEAQLQSHTMIIRVEACGRVQSLKISELELHGVLPSPPLCSEKHCISPQGTYLDRGRHLPMLYCEEHMRQVIESQFVPQHSSTFDSAAIEEKPEMQPLLKDLKLAPSQTLRVGQRIKVVTTHNNSQHSSRPDRTTEYEAVVGRLGKHSLALDIEGRGTMSLSRDEIDGADSNIKVEVLG